jgi:RNA polymerase sigma factor (sigma-70 family)
LGNYTDDDIPRTRKERQQYLDNRYLAKIKGIAPLSEAEELELLTKWHEFRDIKARNRVVEANLRLVQPIAKGTSKRFRFHCPEVMQDLVAAGSLGLCAAADCFDPGKGHKFAHYARRCIRNECIHAAKRVLSVVDRPYYTRTPADLILDQAMPDPISPHDYCGSRARATTGPDRQDEPTRSSQVRLRPWPDGWEVEFKNLGSKIYDLRMAGLTLKETASELGMSITTVWRRQQAYMEARNE